MTIAEMVAASRAAQGLPPKIEDAGTLARVAAILRPNHKVDDAPPSTRRVSPAERARRRPETPEAA